MIQDGGDHGERRFVTIPPHETLAGYATVLLHRHNFLGPRLIDSLVFELHHSLVKVNAGGGVSFSEKSPQL